MVKKAEPMEDIRPVEAPKPQATIFKPLLHKQPVHIVKDGSHEYPKSIPVAPRVPTAIGGQFPHMNVPFSQRTNQQL